MVARLKAHLFPTWKTTSGNVSCDIRHNTLIERSFLNANIVPNYFHLPFKVEMHLCSNSNSVVPDL